MDKKPKIAIIMSGHARMVPWGYQMIHNRMLNIPADWVIFSNLWTNDSESQPVRSQEEQQHSANTYKILSDLGSRHRVQAQGPMFDSLYAHFIEQGAIPLERPTPDGFFLPRSSFDRFMGQIVGFCQALEHWQKELKTYDYIIRSRWDMTLDSGVINELIAPRNGVWAPIFYTKYIDIIHGNVQISGDTIYGSTAAWYDTMPNWRSCRDQLVEGTRQRWNWITENCRKKDLVDEYNQQYYHQCGWFNSHFLWTTMFKNNPNSIIRSRGESLGISTKLGMIPPDELTFEHCMLGEDAYTDPAKIAEIERMHHVDQTIIDSSAELKCQIHQRREYRRQQLEDYIKSQNLH